MSDVSPQELLEVATAVAAEAAALIVKRRRGRITVAATKSTDTDVVTAADRESEDLIRARLLAARPDDGVIGEEGADVTGRSGVRWVVDPIDGTVNYLYDHPAYAVSIAAEADGEAVAAVVVNAALGETFTAARGGGAFRDGEPITVSGCDDLSKALVGTGFGYDAARRAVQAEVIARLITEVRDIRRIGVAALDLCYVACGRLDATYERGLNHWDYAGGALIAAEAGAVLGGLHGAPVSPEFCLAASPAIFTPLHDRLAAADPLRA